MRVDRPAARTTAAMFPISATMLSPKQGTWDAKAARDWPQVTDSQSLIAQQIARACGRSDRVDQVPQRAGAACSPLQPPKGQLLDAGLGAGCNCEFYPAEAIVSGIDNS